jgi:hypothetical protein
VTAEGSTGAPLRQQIAEAIHDEFRGFCGDHDEWDDVGNGPCSVAADAVVALLNLTEEQAAGYDFDADGDFTTWGDGRPLDDDEVDAALATWGGDVQRITRYVTPWLPSTPPDTSPEGAT